MVDINPGAGVYAMFPSFNYKVWGALAEFVDNSVSSFTGHREALRVLHGEDYCLRVMIDVDDENRSLTIRDNAAGIFEEDYERAFRLAIPPADLSHINQYGVGMKAAACWFGQTWSVASTALGENVARKIQWDTNRIVKENTDRLEPVITTADPNDHYTVIELSNLYRSIKGQTASKVKKYLAGIFRKFITSGQVEIFFNGDRLSPPTFPILQARKWNEPDGPEIGWQTALAVQLPNDTVVHGHAYLLATMKRPETALNLFWHDRLIKGNSEPNYRPFEIFGSINSFESGRLCVELDLDDFKPTVEKQDFLFEAGGISEEDLLAALRSELSRPEFDILGQARNYRSGKVDDKTSIQKVMEQIVGSGFSSIVDVVNSPLEPTPASPYPPIPASAQLVAEQLFSFIVDDVPWELALRISDDSNVSSFLSINETARDSEDAPEHLAITLDYGHPFIAQNWSEDTREILIAMALAVGFGEVAARRGGALWPSFVRTNMDELLRRFASNQIQRGSA
jgi:hypothetical protein